MCVPFLVCFGLCLFCVCPSMCYCFDPPFCVQCYAVVSSFALFFCLPCLCVLLCVSSCSICLVCVVLLVVV